MFEMPLAPQLARRVLPTDPQHWKSRLRIVLDGWCSAQRYGHIYIGHPSGWLHLWRGSGNQHDIGMGWCDLDGNRRRQLIQEPKSTTAAHSLLQEWAAQVSTHSQSPLSHMLQKQPQSPIFWSACELCDAASFHTPFSFTQVSVVRIVRARCSPLIIRS